MPTTKRTSGRREYWRQLVNQHEQSGLTVRSFCQQAKVNEHSFYNWRSQLRRQAEARLTPVRFALLEPPLQQGSSWAVELVLTSGEQLRISPGVEEATVRAVIEALRSPRP